MKETSDFRWIRHSTRPYRGLEPRPVRRLYQCRIDSRLATIIENIFSVRIVPQQTDSGEWEIDSDFRQILEQVVGLPPLDRLS